VERAASSSTLHEFMSRNRDRLLATARQRLAARRPDHPVDDLLEGVPDVFDEIVRALRVDAGLSDVPAKPGAAGATVGRSRQERRTSISLIAYGIGALSDAIGEVGALAGMRFAAREYQVFNQAIDESLATAIEEFERRQRTAQQSEHSKRIGFLTHEVRNALSSALLAYRTLKDGAMGINSRTGDVLGRSLGAIQDLIAQSSAAVLLEANAPVDRHLLDLADVVRQLETTTISERGVTVKWEAPSHVAVTGDERLLSSAAGNLLRNALKFTRPGGVVVVRARVEGGRAVLEVEDECGGLPPGSEASLFSPFTREGQNRCGLGLGLPISREAIEALGGRITVTNLPGKGCIFRLDLPSAGHAQENSASVP
jgi:signal transduction histidine kinase